MENALIVFLPGVITLGFFAVLIVLMFDVFPPEEK